MRRTAAAQMIPIHQSGLSEIKAAREALSRGGVRAEIVRPDGCKSNS